MLIPQGDKVFAGTKLWKKYLKWGMTYRLLNDGKMGKNLNDNFITSTKTVFVFLFFSF